MKLELKSLKHLQSLSEETAAYTATVYLDGKPVCNVSNHGTGGPDMQHWIDREAEPKIVAYLAANVSDSWKNYPWSSGELPAYDLEAWCGEQVECVANERRVNNAFRRALKAGIMFTVEGQQGVREIKWKGVKGPFTARHFQVVRERYPAAVILQELPEAEARAIFVRECVR